MEGRCVAGHDLRATLIATLIKDLMQNSLLLEPIDFIRGLRCHQQGILLLADKAMLRLWKLVVVLEGPAATAAGPPTVDLLQKVVLLLAHH